MFRRQESHVARLRGQVLAAVDDDRGPGDRWRLDDEAHRAGDVVGVTVRVPPGPGPWPVVIGGHGGDGHRDAPYLRGASKSWARRGLAMVAPDFPCHGERRGAPDRTPLWESPDLLRRSVVDLRLLVDTLAVDPALDPDRVGYVGFSMGVLIGVPFMAADQRVKAGAFMVGGSPPGAPGPPPPTDPARYAPGVAPRPVLMVNADDDEIYPRPAVFALYDAFQPPKELVFFPGSHTRWSRPARWYRLMREFLTDHLA